MEKNKFQVARALHISALSWLRKTLCSKPWLISWNTHLPCLPSNGFCAKRGKFHKSLIIPDGGGRLNRQHKSSGETNINQSLQEIASIHTSVQTVTSFATAGIYHGSWLDHHKLRHPEIQVGNSYLHKTSNPRMINSRRKKYIYYASIFEQKYNSV